MGARKKAPEERSPRETNNVGARLQAEREEILKIWQNRVRQELPAAREQPRLALLDSLPQFLAQMSEALSQGARRPEHLSRVEDSGGRHGVDRAEKPAYSLQQVLLEYRILREVVFAVLESSGALKPEKRDILFDSFQRAMSSAASEFFRIKLFRERVEQLKSETYARSLQDLQTVTETAIAKSQDFQALVHALLEKIKNIFQCDLVSIYIVTEDQKEALLCASYGMEEDVKKGLRIPLGRGVPGAILKHPNGPLIIEDIHQAGLEIVSSDPKWTEIESIVGMTLSQDTQLIGAMLIGSQKIRSFQDKDIKLFELLAERIGVAVFNSRMYEKAQEELVRFKTDDELRARLLSQLAHEIRNPLAAAQMGAELLVRKKDNPDLIKNLSEHVAEDIQRADKLVKDLLDVNRTLSGREIVIHLERCDLHTIMSAAISTLVPIYGNRFIYQEPDGPEIEGNWSPSELQRAFEQLLRASLDWVKAGGPAVITAKRYPDVVQIEVQAEGSVLSQEKEVSLSELLRTSAKTSETNPQDKGTLELILAEGIIRTHGGEITLLCEKDKSMILTIVLPYDSRPFLKN